MYRDVDETRVKLYRETHELVNCLAPSRCSELDLGFFFRGVFFLLSLALLSVWGLGFGVSDFGIRDEGLGFSGWG